MFTAPRSVQFLGAPIADLHRSNRGTSTRITAVYTPSSERPSSPSQSRAASLYDALGVSLTATSQEIKAAYRRLARTCHPDVGASADEFMRIHTAYSTLSDPGKRADYDRAVLGQRSQGRPVSPFSGGFSRRRTWETDQCW